MLLLAPNEPVPPIVRVPAVTFNPPVKVFAPVRVNFPVPVFVNPPEPDKTPEKIVSVVDPDVKVWLLANTIFPAP